MHCAPIWACPLFLEYWGWPEHLGCTRAGCRALGEAKGSWEQVPRVRGKSGYKRGEQKLVSKLIFELRDIQEKWYTIY